MPDPKQPNESTPKDPPETAEHKHEEELLDEALEESFPASDPISISVEH